jgi:large subunit ribosomal protein L24
MSARNVHVKNGDMVMVIAGKEKGKTGKVNRVFPDQGRVLVEGLNIVKRHTRPSRSNNAGGIIEKEAAFAASNVMIFCKSCNQAARIGHRILEDGSKVRFCKKCQATLDK